MVRPPPASLPPAGDEAEPSSGESDTPGASAVTLVSHSSRHNRRF